LAPALVEAGVVPVIWVGLSTVRLLSRLPPMVTLLTLVKLVPVMVNARPAGHRAAGGADRNDRDCR